MRFSQSDAMFSPPNGFLDKHHNSYYRVILSKKTIENGPLYP
jgi:hypothetical protein